VAGTFEGAGVAGALEAQAAARKTTSPSRVEKRWRWDTLKLLLWTEPDSEAFSFAGSGRFYRTFGLIPAAVKPPLRFNFQHKPIGRRTQAPMTVDMSVSGINRPISSGWADGI
jgi:hypothetical protein